MELLVMKLKPKKPNYRWIGSNVNQSLYATQRNETRRAPADRPGQCANSGCPTSNTAFTFWMAKSCQCDNFFEPAREQRDTLQFSKIPPQPTTSRRSPTEKLPANNADTCDSNYQIPPTKDQPWVSRKRLANSLRCVLSISGAKVAQISIC